MTVAHIPQQIFSPQDLLTSSEIINDIDTVLFENIANDISSKGYSINPSALPEHLCYALTEHIKQMPTTNFKRAGIGRATDLTVNDFVRTDEICWISGNSNAGKAWLDWAELLQKYLNRRLFLGLFSFESHFAHYAKGDFYKTHKDAFKGEENRVLSVVVYLNETWLSEDGGELVIYQDQQNFQQADDQITQPSTHLELAKVTPSFGTIAVFLSEEFPHEVLPAKRDRYSIAGWFRLNTSIANNIDPPK